MIALIKKPLKQTALGALGMQARLRLKLNRPLRFSGVFPTRDQALASLPSHRRAAYDSDDVAEVNFAAMTQRMAWDYPVIYWISTLLQKSPQSHLSILDAGGHMGTKYMAFADLIPIQDLTWMVYDLPAILRAARSLQANGTVPEKVRFIDAPGAAGQVDMLLASGLLQYLDISLAELLGQMTAPPRYVLLNKVAVRDGDSIVTLEKIGPAMVPYHIRAKPAFEASLADLGYRIRDQWPIPDLSHRISTHPWLPASQSKGYMLERVDP